MMICVFHIYEREYFKGVHLRHTQSFQNHRIEKGVYYRPKHVPFNLIEKKIYIEIIANNWTIWSFSFDWFIENWRAFHEFCMLQNDPLG